MYSHRVATQHHRSSGRGGSFLEKKNPTVSVSSPKNKLLSPSSPTGSTIVSPRKSGDFHMLNNSVLEKRDSVRTSRAILASSLDRLGEHHVRQKEYDEAMDAFTEALHEKRSIYANTLESLNRTGSVSAGGSVFDCMENETSEQQDQAIDEIILTLRNMGNVHSLRGEQDEAMRYYTEVTNLRASKSSSKVDTGDDTTLFSGLGAEEDNSTMMSEINEDVKALDDMFRSISFRNRDSSSLFGHGGPSSPKPLSRTENSSSPSSNKRRKSMRGGPPSMGEAELFRRSSSIGLSAANGNDLSDALDLFGTVLDSYDGPNLESQKESFNSLALRADLLSENLQKPESPSSAGGIYAADLELAVEIYQQVLTLQHEIRDFSQEAEHRPEANSNIASTLIRMGSLYYKLGNRLEELRMYTEAKDIYCETFGENHSFVAGARKNIGMVLAERGEYEEAMNEFDLARRVYLNVNGGSEICKDVASALSCMGNVKNRVGELDQALKHYTEALRIYRHIHENDVDQESNGRAVRDVTSTLKVIGMVHAKKSDLDGAMKYFTEAMTLLRSSGVDSAPTGRETTSSVLTRMASIHVKKGDLDQAMDHYRQAYELTVNARGTTNHQDVAGILHYIGGILHKRADYDEAMNCYQEAIRIYHSTLGPCNPAVAGTLVMVGSIHYKRRSLDSAMMFYREALRLNRDAYGLHHPDVAPILKSIGTILTKKGEYHEAYDVFRDVLSIKCTIYGTGHPEVASAYKSLGNVHYKLGELADAERQYRHALSIYRKTKGNEHPDTIGARTTIEHIRYWMKERGQRKIEERHTHNSSRGHEDDERSC